jgi:hypothetical protein
MGSTDGSILLPDGVNLDLSDATITIAGEVLAVESNNTISNLPLFEEALELAFVSDAQGRILLAGFVGDNRTTISVNSTATVLIYFASTAYLQAEEFKEPILSAIENDAEFASFVNELETLFTEDPLLIQNEGFIELLASRIEQIQRFDTTNKNLFVDSGDIRSRIQLKKVGDNRFTISNKGARRAEVFAYKKAFTDLDDVRTVLIEEVGPNQEAQFREPLFQGRYNSKNFPASTPVIEGNYIHALTNCGSIYTETTSAEQTLDLSENESTAEFEITVIGPGKDQGERSMSNAERAAFERMSTETFLLDYLLPTLFEIGGRKQGYDNINGTSKDAALLAVIDPFFQSNSAVKDLVFEGEFGMALQLFFEDAKQNDQIFELLENAYEIASNDNDLLGSFVFTDELSSNLRNMTAIISGITSRFNLFCTDKQLNNIATLESWDLTVERGDVSLEPSKRTVRTFDEVEITAEVEGFEEEELTDGTISYEWSVSENFNSSLKDELGNSGLNFTSTSNKVSFISTASGTALIDFENIETITVKAYLTENGQQQLIGTGESRINIQQKKFLVDPETVLFQGIEQANLEVLNIDYSPLELNENFDFRLVWTTDGSHALFNGTSTSETVVNVNNIDFRNLDDQVDYATQSVRVGIWLRPKNNPENLPFREADFVFVDVYIDNRPTKEIEVSAEGFISESFPDCCTNRTRVLFFGGFIVPYEKDAARYELEILEYGTNGTPAEGLVGQTYTWTNESYGPPIASASFIRTVGNPNTDLVDDPTSGFSIGLNGASVTAPSAQFDQAIDQFGGIFGKAKVTITLKE